MNLCRFNGWIPFEPETRYTPTGRKVICFTAKVRDDHGAESLLRFQMDGDPCAPVPPAIAPGRAVDIEAEAVAQVYRRPDGHPATRLVFHVVRLISLARARNAPDPGQLVLEF
jgi:hypothetical protein